MANSCAMHASAHLPGISKVVAVGSGKGGVGKTTVAVNLAIALAQLGQRVGLLDADIFGPNVPLMMGSTQKPELGENDTIIPNLTYGVKTISVGYLSPDDKPMLLRGPMLHKIVQEFLKVVAWGELDYLIVDLPPGTGDVVLSLMQSVALTGAVVVSTSSDVALQDARKALEMFDQVNVKVLGVVENMSQFICPHCHQEIDIFSKGGAERTASQFSVPFLGSINLVPAIREGGDSGKPIALAGPENPDAAAFYSIAKKMMEYAEASTNEEAADPNLIQIS
jgi:ATP-binding protein involved in chromosome partitioning